MAKCKNCPITKECGRNPIYGMRPVTEGKTVKYQKVRLCPLVMVIAQFQIANEKSAKSKPNE